MKLNLDQLGQGSGAARLGLGIVNIALVGAIGCGLIGVEPDEIDVLDAETGSEPDGDGDGDPNEGGLDTSGDTTGMATGDPSTGDGDGDGDPATTTGDGDGDPSESEGGGDGDGDPNLDVPCDELEPIALTPGLNPVTIAAGDSVQDASCGAAGPEQLYSFSAEAGGEVSFSLINADFDAALYSVDSCFPLNELDCVVSPDTLSVELAPGETVYLYVDAVTAEGGSGELDVTVP